MKGCLRLILTRLPFVFLLFLFCLYLIKILLSRHRSVLQTHTRSVCDIKNVHFLQTHALHCTFLPVTLIIGLNRFINSQEM